MKFKFINALPILFLMSCEEIDCDFHDRLAKEETYSFVIKEIKQGGKFVDIKGYSPKTKEIVYRSFVSSNFYDNYDLLNPKDTVIKQVNQLYMLVKKKGLVIRVNLECRNYNKRDTL